MAVRYSSGRVKEGRDTAGGGQASGVPDRRWSTLGRVFKQRFCQRNVLLYQIFVCCFFFLDSELVFPKPSRPFLELVHNIIKSFFFFFKSFTQNLQRSVYVYLYTIALCCVPLTAFFSPQTNGRSKGGGGTG